MTDVFCRDSPGGNTLRRLEFYLAKARLYDTLLGELNEGQETCRAW
jgi:hypothetical protein